MIELHKNVDDVETFENLKSILEAYRIAYKVVSNNLFDSHIVYNNRPLSYQEFIFLLQRGVR